MPCVRGHPTGSRQMTTDPRRGRSVRESRNTSVGSEENKIRDRHTVRKCSHSECGNDGHSSNWRTIEIVGWRVTVDHLLPRHSHQIQRCGETASESSVQQTGGDEVVDDQPSRKQPAESQGGPATGDVDEDTMVATLLETREFMTTQLAAHAARGRR